MLQAKIAVVRQGAERRGRCDEVEQLDALGARFQNLDRTPDGSLQG
ncbi:MAG: hypothetical protein HC897_19015 [Thermoanaerobaculia bacterium]|nr:hypothetical protein [Thermoanaerobaculia bacterium]